MQHASVPTYPSPLGGHVAHADQFARTLRALSEDANPEDAKALWLTGRADEVAAFVGEVVRDWSLGSLPLEAAAEAIERYLAELHTAIEPWFGRWFAPSCCGPYARISDSGVRRAPRPLRPSGTRARADTLSDVAPIAGTMSEPERRAG